MNYAASIVLQHKSNQNHAGISARDLNPAGHFLSVLSEKRKIFLVAALLHFYCTTI